jgi:predicted glycosyltransferase
MAMSKMYIGDSQTMAAEAAVLGTPSIRFNDFVGEIGYLEELEYSFGLTFGIRTSNPQKLYDKIDELLALPNLKETFEAKKNKMLSQKIDFAIYMKELFEKLAKK